VCTVSLVNQQWYIVPMADCRRCTQITRHTVIVWVNCQYRSGTGVLPQPINQIFRPKPSSKFKAGHHFGGQENRAGAAYNKPTQHGAVGVTWQYKRPVLITTSSYEGLNANCGAVNQKKCMPGPEKPGGFFLGRRDNPAGVMQIVQAFQFSYIQTR